MTDPKYYMRRQDIIAAVAREDFDSASRALYKILIHSIEVDDPHVLSYSFVKTALAILANGPTQTAFNRKYIEKDGTITLDGADKFCNYATTAICLLYTTLMMADSCDEDVKAAKLVMLSLFGSNASVEHIRSRCFLLIFDVRPGNVIHWRGGLFADLAAACTRRSDPSWEMNSLMHIITGLHRKLHEAQDLRWSEKKAYNDELRRLHSEIHTSVEMHEIHEVVLFIKGALCPNGRPKKIPDNLPRGLSQSLTAKMFEVDVKTLAAWEHGRRTPPEGYSALLRRDPRKFEELKECVARYICQRDAKRDLKELVGSKKMRHMIREGIAERGMGMIRDELNAKHRET